MGGEEIGVTGGEGIGDKGRGVPRGNHSAESSSYRAWSFWLYTVHTLPAEDAISTETVLFASRPFSVSYTSFSVGRYFKTIFSVGRS